MHRGFKNTNCAYICSSPTSVDHVFYDYLFSRSCDALWVIGNRDIDWDRWPQVNKSQLPTNIPLRGKLKATCLPEQNIRHETKHFKRWNWGLKMNEKPNTEWILTTLQNRRNADDEVPNLPPLDPTLQSCSNSTASLYD